MPFHKGPKRTTTPNTLLDKGTCTSMASSSRSQQTLKNTDEVKQVGKIISKVEEKEEEKEEWLKLGLGLGSSTSCQKIVEGHASNPILDSPPSSQTLSISQIGVGLGFERDLGSKLGNNSEGLGGGGVVVEMDHPTSDYSNSLLLRWPTSDHSHNDHYYHHNDDENGKVLWPSCQIDPQELPMPVPCDSHHYFARNPHHSGLWFTLHSSTNRSGEALPQIPKAYIRVKDENMTVFMVKKYLVRKLGLSNEAEIDVSCMGQSLSHIQTLRQVRDTIWLPRLVESVNSTTLSLGDSHNMSINHLMSLLYRKHCILN